MLTLPVHNLEGFLSVFVLTAISEPQDWTALLMLNGKLQLAELLASKVTHPASSFLSFPFVMEWKTNSLHFSFLHFSFQKLATDPVCPTLTETVGGDSFVSFPSVEVGKISNGFCPPGQAGNPTRECLAGPEWSEQINNPCIECKLSWTSTLPIPFSTPFWNPSGPCSQSYRER